MIVYPNAKINLGLHVQDIGPDGYHDIDTIYCPVGLSDILEIIPSPDNEFSFSSGGLSIPGDPGKNLCVRAFQLMQRDHDLPPVWIYLHKIIPMGAGLGGGSSDGAFTVKVLNDLFHLGLSEEQMMHYTRQLGSDCTFFIRNKASFGFGRGDKLEPVNLDLSDYNAVIVVPSIHMDTAMAYSMIDQQRAANPFETFRDIHKGCHMINITESGPASWRWLLHNDFESPVFTLHPLLAGIKQQMYENGAIYASMSGSGSAIYGIFPRDYTPEQGTFGDYFTWCGILH